MAVKESLQETLHSQRMEYSDEAEETLSLCDLPLHSGGGADWEEEFSTESQGGSSSTSSLEQDYFEFFSQDMSISAFPPENIVFCGKIIPYRLPAVPTAKDSKLVETKKMRLRGKVLFWLKLNSLFSKNGTKIPNAEKNIEKKSLVILPQSSKKVYSSNYMGNGKDFPNRKMSSLTSSSGKARWYLFGITGFSTNMRFRDIKNRQSHHESSPSSSMFQFRSGDESDDKAIGSRVSEGKGAWELIRALSCGGSHPTNLL